MARVLLGCLLGCLLVVGILGCGDSEAERRAQALNVAQGWTETSTETVVAEIVTLATAGIPGASLFDTLIASQIADFLEWEYSDPVEVSEGIYRVTTTVATGLSLDLPLLGTKAYEARLPFDLDVDLSTESVTRWSADFDSAWVGEVELDP